MGCTRPLERVAAALGKLEVAPTCFVAAQDVSCGGVLWALPALLSNGLLAHQDKHFQLPKGYYSLIHIFVLAGFMALARIQSLEGLRYCPPGEWGKLLGLDRIPEVRTMRAKLSLLAQGEVREWSTQLSRAWMEADPELAGRLYVDGHVRVYHGAQTPLPKRYVSRERLCLRGTTDYWVNDQEGQPFFVVSRAPNEGLIAVLRQEIVPRLLKEVPRQPTQEALTASKGHLRWHRFTLIFDREGYSPVLFQEMLEQSIACSTYRKQPGEDWPESEFSEHAVQLSHGQEVKMKLAERGVWLGGLLWVREIRKLTPSGHQVAMVTTDFITPTARVAAHMFARWSQENFFKYTGEHFGLDRLVEYQTEPLSEPVEVVNPAWRKLTSEIKTQAAKLARKRAQFGALSLEGQPEAVAVETYQQKKSQLQEEAQQMDKALEELKENRRQVAHHIPVDQLPEKERFVQLAWAKKHLVDMIKMIAYRSETALAVILRAHLSNSDEARSLLREIFRTEADLMPDETAGTLTVRLHHLANPVSDERARILAEELTAAEVTFPGTNLRLIYELVSA